jgi:hypothetical protein
MKKPIRFMILAFACAAAQLACSLSGSGSPAAQSSSNGYCANVNLSVVEGATWTYSGTGSSGAVTRVDTITDVGTNGFLLESKLTDANGVTSSVNNWSCTADGLVMGMPDAGQFSAVSEGSGGGAQATTLSVTGVSLPISITVGDTWTQTLEVQVTSTTFNGIVSSVLEMNAAALETMTVPAGTFQALRIEGQSTMTFEEGGGVMTQYLTEWLVPGIGTVREVSSADVGGFGANETYELTSYSLP